MIAGLLLVVIVGLCWGFVKQTALTFDKPEWWDRADQVVFVVSAVGMAYVDYPYVQIHPDPMMILLRDSLIFAVGMTIMSFTLTMLAEEEGILPTPDGLAPFEARLREQVNTVDELDAETLEGYQ